MDTIEEKLADLKIMIGRLKSLSLDDYDYIHGDVEEIQYLVGSYRDNSEWISVNDKLPEEGSRVVAAFMYDNLEGGDPDAYVSWYYNGRFTVDGDGLDIDNGHVESSIKVTHWHPLPKYKTCKQLEINKGEEV